MNCLRFLVLVLPCCLIFSGLQAQWRVSGLVTDEKGTPLELSTTALLFPADSTVAYFAMSDERGAFQLTGVSTGDYLLHVSQFGYAPKLISLRVSNHQDVGLIVLEQSGTHLDEVQIIAERTPLVINGDTIEYNAAAFNTKPDAVVEDLLKKLPGVEVDAAGNIKAQGQTIEKITIDGKEFFSDDPKVVSKNLPADAVKKVQVFDGKTDQEQFSGIDDGNQDRTINLVLKEDRKRLWFGSVMAGAGTGWRYQSAVKAFRFSAENQFAVLGSSNNVNQFGFSINDYIDFNGGIRNLANGNGRLEFNSSEETPIDFGQPISGRNLSGIGAFNYTRTAKPGKTVNITGMGTGRQKQLREDGFTEQYLPNGLIRTHTADTSVSGNGNYRINFLYRDKSDSSRLLTTGGYLQFGNGGSSERSFGSDSSETSLLNERRNVFRNRNEQWRGGANFNLGYRFRTSKLSDLMRFSVSGSGMQRTDRSVWSNDARLLTVSDSISDQQHFSGRQQEGTANASLSSTKRLRANWYLETAFSAGISVRSVNRVQEEWLGSYVQIDSLTAPFGMSYTRLVPSAALRYAAGKLNFQLTAAWETGQLGTKTHENRQRTVQYPVPFLTFSYERKQGRFVALDLTSRVAEPSAEQLNPLTVTVNRLQTMNGNPQLRPEYLMDASLRWNIFDHFSFVSFFTGLRMTYTRDKIVFNREVLPDFTQVLSYENMPEDYAGSAFMDFSAPIKPLHIAFHLKLSESWNKGFSRINTALNATQNWSHAAEIMFENRKKTKWDVQIGDRITVSTATYSLQHNLNSTVTENTVFATVQYSPNDRWNVEASADMKHYFTSNGTFNTVIPLVRCSAMRTLLKSHRASIKLEVFDLLDRNTGLQQFMQQTVFRVTRSTMLQRYAMLSFTWKINKGKNAAI